MAIVAVIVLLPVSLEFNFFIAIIYLKGLLIRKISRKFTKIII